MAKKTQDEKRFWPKQWWSFHFWKEHVIFTCEDVTLIRESSPCISSVFIPLFRLRLSYKSVKENATRPISIMGSDWLMFLDPSVTMKCLAAVSIKQPLASITNSTIRHSRVRFYTFAGQPFLKIWTRKILRRFLISPQNLQKFISSLLINSINDRIKWTLPLTFPGSTVQRCSSMFVSFVYTRHPPCQYFSVFGWGIFCSKMKGCFLILISMCQMLLFG